MQTCHVELHLLAVAFTGEVCSVFRVGNSECFLLLHGFHEVSRCHVT